MKKLGITLLIASNLYLSYYYVKDLALLFQEAYHYDGMRYFIPLLVADVLFVVAILLLIVSAGFNRVTIAFSALCLLHNVAIGLGVANIPFVGFTTVLLTLVLAFSNKK